MTTVTLKVEIDGYSTEILFFTIREDVRDGFVVSIDNGVPEQLDPSKMVQSIQQAQADKCWAFPLRYCRYQIGSDQLQGLLDLCNLNGINYELTIRTVP